MLRGLIDSDQNASDINDVAPELADEQEFCSAGAAKANITKLIESIRSLRDSLPDLQTNIAAYPFARDIVEIDKADISRTAVAAEKSNLNLHMQFFLRHNEDALKVEKLKKIITNFINDLPAAIQIFFSKIGQLNQTFHNSESLIEMCFRQIAATLVTKVGESQRAAIEATLNEARDTKSNFIAKFLKGGVWWVQLNGKVSLETLNAVKEFISLISLPIPIGFDNLKENSNVISFDRLLAFDYQSVIEFRIALDRLRTSTPSELLQKQILVYKKTYPVPAVLEYFVNDIVDDTAKYEQLKLVRAAIKKFKANEKSIEDKIAELKKSIDLLKELVIKLLRACAIHAIYQTLHPDKAYSDIHYRSIMHWWHHGTVWKASTYEDSILFKFIEDIFLIDKNDLDAAAELVKNLFKRHKTNYHGLHTNSFDTFFLQLLFNEGFPTGILYLYNFEDFPIESTADFENYNFAKNKLKYDLGVSQITKPASLAIDGPTSKKLRGGTREQSARLRHTLFRESAAYSINNISLEIKSLVDEIESPVRQHINL